MCYNRYSGSNHWGRGRYGGGVRTQGWGVPRRMVGGVEFMLPRGLSSHGVVYALCLVSGGDFPIARAMFVILKVSVK